MRPTLLVLGTALLMAACGVDADGPPDIQVDRTACSHCGMLVSEPIYAAAYRAAGAESRVFDDIGCLLNALEHDTGSARRFWFHDASTGKWIDGSAAVFVVSSGIRTPMGGGVIAYIDGDAAGRTAQQHNGAVVGTLAGLLARHGAKS